jgi:hypothetical protein
MAGGLLWDTDITGLLIFLAVILVLNLLTFRLMYYQYMWAIEREIPELERITRETEEMLIRKLFTRPRKELREKVSQFLDYFTILPVSLDPYGIVKKISHLIRNSERRFDEFIEEIRGKVSTEEKMNLRAAFTSAMTSRQVLKIIKHYHELGKKYKSYLFLVPIQTMLPLLKNIIKACKGATHAFLEEIPIGDSIGPLIACKYIDKVVKVYEEEEFVLGVGSIEGKKVYVAKALGPGATTGFPGEAIRKILSRRKIERIITIDAALKLECEKTGEVAFGTGVAMGGIGVDRFEIEEIATKNNIMLDAVVVKQSNLEALQPMKREILDSVEKVDEVVRSIVKRCRSGRVLIIGVGNTCGVGNTKEDFEKAVRKIRRRRVVGEE